MDSLALELDVCCAYVETGIRPPLNSDRSTLVAQRRVMVDTHARRISKRYAVLRDLSGRNSSGFWSHLPLVRGNN